MSAILDQINLADLPPQAIVETVDAVKKVADAFAERLPEGTVIGYSQDKSDMIRQLLGDLQNSVLVLLADRNDNVELSARNLPDVKTLLAGYVNVRDVLGHETLVLTPDTVAEIERILG